MSLHYGSDCIGYDMLEIPSNPSISSSVTFNGDITFSIQQPGEECFIVPKKSYISAQIQIIQTREGYASNNGNIGPNTNGTCTLEPIINLGSRLSPTAVSVPFIMQARVLHYFKMLLVILKVKPSQTFKMLNRLTHYIKCFMNHN